MIFTWSPRFWPCLRATFLVIHSALGLGIWCSACCRTTAWLCTEAEIGGDVESDWQASATTWTWAWPTVVSNNLHTFNTTLYAALENKEKRWKFNITWHHSYHKNARWKWRKLRLASYLSTYLLVCKSALGMKLFLVSIFNATCTPPLFTKFI